MQIGALSAGMGSGPSPAMRDRLFKKADSNSDGSLSLDEFKALRSNKPKEPDPVSATQTDEEVFASFDADGDGQLSQTEMDSGMEARIQAFQDELRTALFKQADSDGDGSLSESEFAALEPQGPPPPPRPSTESSPDSAGIEAFLEAIKAYAASGSSATLQTTTSSLQLWG